MIRLTRRTSKIVFYTAGGESVVTDAIHADGDIFDDGAEYMIYGDGSERLTRRRPRFECRVMDANAAQKLRGWARAGVAVSATTIGRGRLAQFIDPAVPVCPELDGAQTFAADGYPVRLASSLRTHRSGVSHDLFLDPLADLDGDGIADGWTLTGGSATFAAGGQQVGGAGTLSRDRFLPVAGLRLAAFVQLSSVVTGAKLRCIALDGAGVELESSETAIDAGAAGYYFARLVTPAGTDTVRVELEASGISELSASRIELVVDRDAAPLLPPVPPEPELTGFIAAAYNGSLFTQSSRFQKGNIDGQNTTLFAPSGIDSIYSMLLSPDGTLFHGRAIGVDGRVFETGPNLAGSPVLLGDFGGIVNNIFYIDGVLWISMSEGVGYYEEGAGFNLVSTFGKYGAFYDEAAGLIYSNNRESSRPSIRTIDPATGLASPELYRVSSHIDSNANGVVTYGGFFRHANGDLYMSFPYNGAAVRVAGDFSGDVKLPDTSIRCLQPNGAGIAYSTPDGITLADADGVASSILTSTAILEPRGFVLLYDGELSG
jgi:hypothetical protein